MDFAELEWRGNTPGSRRHNDLYFSRGQGLAEARHVFLAGNRLAERWARRHDQHAFVIVETGFGCALNFLATWQAWAGTEQPGRHLHFISVERYPVRRPDLERTLAAYPELAPYTRQLVRQYCLLVPGWNRFQFRGITLSLYVGDGLDGLNDWAGQADAWFLDGFAPARNPDFWTPELFQLMARKSHGATTLGTFTAARAVRDGLTAAGFELTRVPGQGHKRHNLVGHFIGPRGPVRPLSPPRQPQWPAPRATAAQGSPVAVMGSGIAAAEVANRLWQRGIPVILIAPDAPGSAASGNPQGVLYVRPGRTDDPGCRLQAAALSYRCRHWSEQLAGEQTGVLQLQPADDTGTWLTGQHPFAQLMRQISADSAEQLAGTRLTQPAYWFPQAGWINPARTCANLLAPITHWQAEVSELARDTLGWQVQLSSGTRHYFRSVVIACGHASNGFAPTAELPIRPVSGQVTLSHAASPLRLPVCAAHYVTPPDTSGLWTFGATYEPGSATTATTDQADQANQARLAAMLPDLPVTADGARAGVRATTPDHQALAGPVPRLQADWDDHQAQSGIHAEQSADSCFQPGLFILAGLGSKGLVSAPILAEQVVSQMLGEPAPLGHSLARLVHPARFVLRRIRAGRA